MKPAQWAVAAFLLAAMVFAVTFAMNYLGGPPKIEAPATKGNDPESDRTLTFLASKVIPADGSIHEVEAATSNYYDYWFINEHDKEVLIGLRKLSCRCSAVEAFVIPGDRRPQEASLASLVGARPAGPLAALAAWRATLAGFAAGKGLTSYELLHSRDSAGIPANAVGWLRMRWKGERAGAQTLYAVVWMNDSLTGPEATLELRAMNHDPMRLRTTLPVGVLTDEELGRGVTRYIEVWSSTRPEFRLQARPAVVRGGGSASDPFEVGTPEPLTDDEMARLRQDNNAGDPGPGDAGHRGRVVSGYKVPVRFRAVSPDGKVPFDIGPFRRSVVLSSPDVDGEPRVVEVTGRVRGLIELGVDDEGGHLDFGPFPRRLGTQNRILSLQSGTPGVKLEFDRQRTPQYLTATVEGPAKLGESRQQWKVRARVLPNKASGSFPRVEDPLYEDSAVYLTATAPGKPPRSIRIAVRGTANES